MKRVTNKLLAIVLSFAMVLTGFTFLGGSFAAYADDGDKPENVYMARHDGVDEFQEASGGTFKWTATNADYMLWDPLIEMVDASDFQLQTKKVTESEWVDAQGTLTVSAYSDSGDEDIVTIEADIPDNTGDEDISWRVIYKHSDVSLQIEDGVPIHITQKKPESVTPEKPQSVQLFRDDDSYDVENPQFQPASGGKYIWLAMDVITLEDICGKVTADDFKLQTKSVMDSEYVDSTVGSLAIEDDEDDYGPFVRVTATIPDNEDDFDKDWILVYKHSEQSTQVTTCDDIKFTQMKPEAQPSELPAIKNIAIDEPDSSANQPAKGGVYAWYFNGALDADFSEVTSSDFTMQVKVGDEAWADSDAAVAFELGDNDDEGVVTATVPDNTEAVARQWRFKYAGESVECPPITQAAKASWDASCFTCSEDKTTITGLTEEGVAMVEEDPDMVIPASCDGVKVTAIGDNAFANAKITNVRFPVTLKSIGAAAFSGCTELKSLTLPASLETIGQQAFNNTTKLESITFEEGIKITEIPQAAFQKVSFGVQIKEITVPDSVTVILANAFGGTQVETLVLPAGLEEIGDRAFMNNKLSSITIPDKVEKIGKQAFSQAQAKVRGTLTTLDFGNNTVIASVGAQAFEYAKLKTVNMPESVKALDKDTFKNNSGGESEDKKVILNLTSHDQFTSAGDYANFVADGSGHRSMFNGVMNYQIKFDTAGRSIKNDAYTKDGKLSEADLAAARSSKPYDVFDGWFTEAEGGEAIDENTVFEADTTLYAHWSENTALMDAEEAVADAVTAADTAQTAADKAAETGAEDDVKAAAEALEAAEKAVNDAKEKLAAAQEFANNHSISGTGTTRTNTAAKNLAKANAGVTKLDAAEAAKAADDAAAAAAAAKPGTQDAVDKAAAAVKAANDALAKAEAAKAAAEEAYGADSEQAKDAAQAVEDAKTAAKKADDAKTAADKAKAEADKKAADEAAAAKAKSVTTVTVNVKTVTAAAIDNAVKAAGGSNLYVTKIVLGKKVKTIKSKAFKNYSKVTVLEVKTKKLTKKSVKKALKGSKIKTVKVKISKKAATNKKYVKKYKKFFTKKNAGKKVTVKK